MPRPILNLRHLERQSARLEGEITPEEMDLETLDELIQTPQPLTYSLEAEKLEGNILVKGHLRIVLQCECGRCLKPYEHVVDLPSWSCLLELSGDDKAPVVNDCVDLTPYLREDTLLAFPLHPLCGSDCGGLTYPQKKKKRGTTGEATSASSAWAELNKLKL